MSSNKSIRFTTKITNISKTNKPNQIFYKNFVKKIVFVDVEDFVHEQKNSSTEHIKKLLTFNK